MTFFRHPSYDAPTRNGFIGQAALHFATYHRDAMSRATSQSRAKPLFRLNKM